MRDDEDDEDDNDNDDRKDGKEEEERTGERRNWFRRSNDRISSSAPEDGNLNRGSYPDVQVLGAYPRIRHSWNSIGPHSIGSRFDFQRRSLRVLPIETKPASFSTAEARKKENREREVEESADPEERPSRDKTSTTDGVRSETGCSCEGACGCATVIPADFEGSEIRARKGKEEKEEEEQAEQEQEQEEEDEEEEEEEEERGLCSSRKYLSIHRIHRRVRRRMKWQEHLNALFPLGDGKPATQKYVTRERETVAHSSAGGGQPSDLASTTL